FSYYQYKNRAARFSTIETEYGLINGAYRPAEEDSYYFRVTQILFPFYHMIPGNAIGTAVRIGMYVPVDDEHHLQWEIGTLRPDPGLRRNRDDGRNLRPLPRAPGHHRLDDHSDEAPVDQSREAAAGERRGPARGRHARGLPPALR